MLVNYQFATNNFATLPANSTDGQGAFAPYSSVTNGNFLSSASAITPVGASVVLSYRTNDSIINNGNAAASAPDLDARLTSATPNTGLYFQFSFTASVDFDLTNLAYDLASGSTGSAIRGADVQYSLDGFTTFTDLGTNSIASGTTQNSFFNFSDNLLNTLVSSGQTVTFRFDPFVSSGSAGGVRFDNIEVDGVTPVPEPASMAVLALGGLSVLLLKRRRA